MRRLQLIALRNNVDETTDLVRIFFLKFRVFRDYVHRHDASPLIC